ncbi:nucleotidyltransferase domain-containing protein [Candidatus Peregrinibacteria bacterium]|nr:nucleotidyltransferase domain-containing protein [Candidatus Peregrinibacteria bacterium]
MKLESVFKKYGIEAVYLFGSRANGKIHKKSDIDIAVRFSKKLSLQKLLMLANELTSSLGAEADILDLDSAPLPLQFRVFQARKLLYAKNPKEEILKQAKAITLYFDYKYYYDRFVKFETDRILQHGLI